MSVSLLKISPALRILVDAKIVDLDEPDYGYRDEFTFELQGPWQGSDYSGDDVTESNQRSLVRDFPDLLMDRTRFSGWGSYGLQVEPDFGMDPETAEHAEYLANVLVDLVRDYPLYDEEDNSNLIHERARESWEQYLRSDLQSEVCQLTGAEICLDDMEDEFWELIYAHDIYPEAEGHKDVVFRGVGDREFLLDLARKAVELGALDQDYMSDLTEDGYALIGAWMAEGLALVHPGQLALIPA